MCIFFFFQLLQAVEPLFVQGLSHFSGSHSSPEISQLLVVLSDGRGVFADGTLVCNYTLQCIARCLGYVFASSIYRL